MGILKNKLDDQSRSAFRAYQDIVLGSRSLSYLLRHEITMLAANSRSGALGLLLRNKLYPKLFAHVGPRCAFGRNLAIRNAEKISIGEGCIIDDACALDGASEAPLGIQIGARVMIARNVQISCKGGRIVIGDRVGVGANSELRAIEGNVLEIGDDVLIAPSSYLGGSVYHTQRLDLPISEQGLDPRGGVRIGAGSWIGAGAVVMDGTSIGRGAIVAAGAVVTHDVPEFTIAAGVPARIVRSRSSAPSSQAARVGAARSGERAV